MQHQHQQDHTTSTPPDDDSTTPTLPTFSKLSVSSSEKERASDQTRDDDQYPTSEDEEEDEEEEDEGDNSSALPSFKLPTFAPQLDFLSLPSPIFGGSFVDLLSLPGTSTPDRPPSRLRTSSRVSVHDRHDRAPTLNFSNPRPDADRRTRRAGKEEDCFVTAFPVDPLEVPVDDPARWGDADWEELKGFLLQRGYEVPAHQPKTGRGAQAERVSDSLPLHLHLVPINDESWELDVVEYISSAGIRTKSQAQGVLACLPVVAIVAVSEDWTAVLVERWESPSSIANFGSFAKDVASALSFLHLNHISYLDLSPSTIVVSPTSPARYTLSSFASSIQADALAKRPTLVSGWSGRGYRAPEIKDDSSKFDPQSVDAYQLGRLLQEVSTSNKATNVDLSSLIVELTAVDPKSRPSVASALQTLKRIYV